MKLSEIRAKFPMYADVSDDQLLISLHKKYYSDIPIGKFTKAIEYDNAPDPTEGMTGAQKQAAGMGKAFTDIARGIGQTVGLVSREDVADSRQRDAPLMQSGRAQIGNLLGNVGALSGTALIPGAATVPGAALIGAGAGFLLPSVSTEETVKNTAIGGAIPLVTAGATHAVPALYQGAKALVEPLTKSGQERIAARVLQGAATNPAQAAANAKTAQAIVPGSSPTLAQTARDPGLAQLERTLLNNPEYAGPLQQRFAQQRAARLDAVRNVAGADDYYNAIKDGRRVFANQDYDAAIAQGIDPKMAQAMQPQINNLMSRPSMQEAQKVAKRLAAEEGQTLTDFGSVKGLDWLKKALDNQISAAKRPGGQAIGDAELRALVQTKNDLMQTIEQISPAYKVANDNFAMMSRQVNSMDVARDLLKQLQRPGSEYSGGTAREMGQQYSQSLSKAVDSVKKSTGMDRRLSDVMDTRDIAALENVARDYGRKAFAETAGAARGSPTVQNMLSQNMLRQMMGPAGLPQSWAESTMLQSLLSPVQVAGNLTGANQRVMERLAASLLDPADAVTLLTATQAAPRGLLAGPEIRRLIPAGSASLLATD